MPNIHLCGFPSGEANVLKNEIDALMQDLGLGDDAVTTIWEVTVQSCDGKRTPRPYVAISSSSLTQMGAILGIFKKAQLGVDVECVTIDEFIPACDMK